MKKWIFGLILTLVAVLSVSLTVKVNAATLKDRESVDDFENGIGEEYIVVNDEAGAYGLLEKPGQLKLQGMDYANGYFHTKNQIEVPEGQALVVQFEVVDSNSAGWFGLTKGAKDEAFGTAWGDMIYYGMNGGTNMVNEANGNVGYQGDEVTQSAWANSHLYTVASLQRQVYYADGSARMYGSKGTYSEADLTEFYYYAAGQIGAYGTGYVGFVGNGYTGYIILDNIKIGTMDSTGTITWVIEDTCDTMDNWTWDTYSTAKMTIGGAAKYMQAENPVSGASILVKEQFTANESDKMLKVSLTANVTALQEGKSIGIILGVDPETKDVSKATYVGVAAKGTDVELVTYVNGELKKEVVVGPIADVAGVDSKLVVEVERNEKGRAIVTGIMGGESVEQNVASIDGLFGISSMGDGKLTAKIVEFEYVTYQKVVEEGKNYAFDFESEDIDGLKIITGETGTVKVVDGVLRVNNPGDGTYIGINEKYVNFLLKFDILVQQAGETEEGTPIPATTWCGINFAKESFDAAFWAAPLAYQQLTTLDALNLTWANTGSTRVWTGPATDMHSASNNGRWFTIEVAAVNGKVFYLAGPQGEEPELVGYTTEMNTDGYVTIGVTAGAYFDIDNFCIINTDNAIVDSTFALAAYDQLKGKVADKDARIAEINKTLSDLQTTISEYQDQIAQADSAKEAAEAERDQAVARAEAAEAELAEIKKQVEDAKAEIEAAQAVKAELEAKVAELEAAAGNVTAALGCESMIGATIVSISALVAAIGFVAIKKREEK